MSTDPLYARFGRDFPEGHVLFREGEAGSVMYVVQRGRVRIARQLPGGERTLAVLGPGEFFGEMAILNHKPRTATATALEPVQALEIGARTLEAMVMSNPELAVRLITKLARRLDSANAVVEILSHHDPRVRVVLGLARAADATGEATAAGLRVPMSADEFAASVGLDTRDGTLRGRIRWRAEGRHRGNRNAAEVELLGTGAAQGLSVRAWWDSFVRDLIPADAMR